MRNLLLVTILLISLGGVKGCIDPDTIIPGGYICLPFIPPPGGQIGVNYFWVGIRVKPFAGTGWPPFCACGIKFPSCIIKVVKVRLTWRNKYTHLLHNIPFPLTRDNETGQLMDNDPVGDYGGYPGNWRGFRGVFNRSTLVYPNSYHYKWELVLWYLVCVYTIQLQCPWILMSAGGVQGSIGQLSFVSGHQLKIIVPTVLSYGGDPAVNTFDGMHYEFQGLCSYILTMDCNEKLMTDKKTFKKFKVIGVNKPCDLGSCLGSVIIYLKDSNGHDVRIDLLPGFEPLVNGTKINLLKINEYTFDGGKLLLSVGQYSSPDAPAAAVDSSFLAMFANVSQEYVRLETDSNLAFMWNGVDNLIMPDKKELESINTCGLLGNLDGNLENDMRYPDGSVVPILPSKASNDLEEAWIIQSFVHNWVARQPNDPVNCKSSVPRILCDGNKEKSTLSRSICDGFVKSYQSNPKCNIEASSAQELYNRCVHDMCFCYNDDIFACARYLYHALESRCH